MAAFVLARTTTKTRPISRPATSWIQTRALFSGPSPPLFAYTKNDNEKGTPDRRKQPQQSKRTSVSSYSKQQKQQSTSSSSPSLSSFSENSNKKETTDAAEKQPLSTSTQTPPQPFFFQKGDKIQVEIAQFGPLGASVYVIAHGSHDPKDCIAETAPVLAKGLILQKELHYFRQARNNLDVIRGEVLPAYVEGIRSVGGVILPPLSDDDRQEKKQDLQSSSSSFRLDVSLRAIGQQAKAMEVVDWIVETLETDYQHSLPIGDKSSPEEIAAVFPGISKSTFKRAIATLYKQGTVQPGPYSIQLLRTTNTTKQIQDDP